ncbi:MAG: DUF1840 domain-containing protein [Gallionella sp.]|nr:DUF1840 domain-containing protein [Gallionella sp.]MDD4946714.1 DUF1840 domain-containing protein [Gallionella sp.]
MLVTFKTDFHANILMFGDDARAMLKVIGHSGTIPSAILAEDVPAARDRLVAAVEAQKAVTAVQEKDTHAVSFINRARPLIELFDDAVKKSSNVMWE